MTEIEGDSRYADVVRAGHLQRRPERGLPGRHALFLREPPRGRAERPGLPPGPRAREGPSACNGIGCACCPPNIARLVASIASYSLRRIGRLRSGCISTRRAKPRPSSRERRVRVRQKTDYPWTGAIAFSVDLSPALGADGASGAEFSLMLRIPAWCRPSPVRSTAAPRLAGPSPRATWRSGGGWKNRRPGRARTRDGAANPLRRREDTRACRQARPPARALVYCAEECDNGPGSIPSPRSEAAGDAGRVRSGAHGRQREDSRLGAQGRGKHRAVASLSDAGSRRAKATRIVLSRTTSGAIARRGRRCGCGFAPEGAERKKTSRAAASRGSVPRGGGKRILSSCGGGSCPASACPLPR